MSFRSTEAGSARYLVGPVEYASTGWALLVRLQEILRNRQWRSGRKAAYRTGGPVGRENTAFDPASIRQDANHGAVTNAALWLATAELLIPNASVEDLVSGGAIVDAGIRNVLDKVEQSYVERRLHPTAAEAALFVIHASRGDTTAAQFMARQGPRLSETERGRFDGWPVRGSALPAPVGLLARLVYPAGARIDRAVYLVTIEGCSTLGDQISTERIATHLRSGAQPLGRLIGSAPRIVRRNAAALASCTEEFSAAWPIEVTAPQIAGLAARVDYEFARVLERGFPVGLRVAAVPFAPTTHGALSFWESGEAQRTQTRDDTNVLARPENAVGPDALAPRPTLGDVAAGAAKDILPVVGVAALVAAGAWFLSRK